MSLARKLLGNPLRAAVIVGLAVSLLFGYVSFPRQEQVTKTVTGLPGTALSASLRDDLQRSLRAAEEGAGVALRRVGLSEFEGLALPLVEVLPRVSGGSQSFDLVYIGKSAADSRDLYVAESKVHAGPWWSPDRFLYRALRAEVDQFGRVVDLTFERDWQGLVTLLVWDVLFGAVYGGLAGLAVAALGAKSPEPPARPHPAQAQGRPPLRAPASAPRAGRRPP